MKPLTTAITCAYTSNMETNTTHTTSRKTTRQSVFQTLNRSGWTQYTRTSTNVRGHWHESAGWKINNAKAGEPIIVWHFQGTSDKADIGERLSSYAYELRIAGFDASIKEEANRIPYIKINR